MTADIINIGDEILIGQIVNTNAAWMAEQLTELGVTIRQVSVVADEGRAITKTIKESFAEVDLILLTGGLGPTKDDITKQVLCELFDTRLRFDEEAYEMIREFFASRNLRVSELNRQQAELPEKCSPLPNRNGTAPGMWFEEEGKILVAMPGVPYEMKGIMEESVLPRLLDRNGGTYILHKTVLTHGMGESFLTRRLEHWEDTLPASLSLAYLPSPGQVRMRLTARGDDKEKLQADIDSAVEGLKKRIPELIFGYDKETMPGVVGKILKERKETVGTAESCTGGYIAHMITSIAGSSEYFMGSIVSYSNEIKSKALDVDPSLIEEHGAVSGEVVRSMAEGGRKALGVDWCIATSGIAGPDGGTDEKPVGLVWIAVSGPDGTEAKEFRFGNRRDTNIHKSGMAGLNMLRKKLTIAGLSDATIRRIVESD